MSRDGYIKFNIAVQRAIVGNQLNDDDLEFNAEVDWEHDLRVYGVIDEMTFYDVLFELIENVIEFEDPLHYTAFAWALLNAVAGILPLTYSFLFTCLLFTTRYHSNPTQIESETRDSVYYEGVQRSAND